MPNARRLSDYPTWRKCWTFCVIGKIRKQNASPEVSRGGTIMRKNKGLLTCGITMVIAALTLTVTTAAADQLSGTWKMNAEKSKYSPGPAPKDLTVVVESDES